MRFQAFFTFGRLIRDAGLPKLLLKARVLQRVAPRPYFALALLNSSSTTEPTGGKKAFLSKPGDAEVSGKSKEVWAGDKSSQEAMLFTGCVMEELFTTVNRATARVLAVNGCATRAPEGQACCGALHAHAGDMEGARRLARHNIDAFKDSSNVPIITNAGGCGAMLVSYDHLLADDPEYAERAREFSRRVRDVSQQLEVTGILQGAEVGESVTTYDASCHLLYGQRASEASLRMLRAIPNLQFVPLEGSDRCCGGAGVYNLIEPELSSRVLDEKLQHIKATGAQVLATGNPGCHMQIGAGAQMAGVKLRVCHPVELLDESYARAGFYKDEGGRIK